MSVRPATVLVLLAASGSACSSILPRAPQATYYDLTYDPAPVECARSYSSPVDVPDFSASSPYDRSEMVVTDGREVSFSRRHEWVGRPGTLVAQRLRRDLSAGTLFPLVVSGEAPVGGRLELTGTLYRFAWEREGRSARAHLEADVVLVRPGGKPEVLLHQRYDLQSEPSTSPDDSAAFARAMSGVVDRFSAQLRRDLCAGLDRKG